MILRLSDFPALRVEIACDKCGRRGSYSVARAIDQHGDMRLPDFLATVTADCARRQGLGSDRCAALFPQLAGRRS